MTPEQFRAVGHRLIDWIADYRTRVAMLPVMARTINQQDDVSIVELVNVKLNQEPPKDVFDAQAPAGWQVQVEELKPEIRR